MLSKNVSFQILVRSPVFAAMFDNNLEEKKKNAANIQDIDSTVLKDMILFMYCGKITNFENTCELFVAADKVKLKFFSNLF